MKYYARTKSGEQGLVIEEETGRTVAVTFDQQDAPLLAAAPDLFKFAEDIIRYLEAGGITSKDDRRFVIQTAEELVKGIKAQQDSMKAG